MKNSKRLKHQKALIIGLCILAVAAMAAFALRGRIASKSDYYPKAAEVTPKPSSAARADKSVAPAASPTAAAAVPPQVSKNGSVAITSPAQGATVTSGTHVTGTAVLGSGQLYYRVKGGKSGQLALGPVPVNGDKGKSQPYSFDLAFTNQVSGGHDEGVLEVYVVAADGTITSDATLTVNIQG
jgi:hypothetical protein